jgi:hypothetical protein
MTRSITVSTPRLALVTAAGIAAAIALIFAASHGASANAGTAAAQPATAQLSAAQPAVSAKSVAFREAMNKLWEDHITWTRMVIVDFAAGLPDLKVAETRLLRNQVDIGNAIKPYYGAAAGNKLTSLLRAHILGAVPVLADAKAGDKAKLTEALNAWYANGHEIAQFLAAANPQSWPLPMMDSMMKNHLDLTAQEAVARLQGKWAADVRAYDKVHVEILQMADMLSSGIVNAFPNRF